MRGCSLPTKSTEIEMADRRRSKALDARSRSEQRWATTQAQAATEVVRGMEEEAARLEALLASAKPMLPASRSMPTLRAPGAAAEGGRAAPSPGKLPRIEQLRRLEEQLKRGGARQRVGDASKSRSSTKLPLLRSFALEEGGQGWHEGGGSQL